MLAISKRIESDSLSHLPPELVDFARRQFVNAMLYKGDERRREQRHPMVVPVRAVAVDEKDRALGTAFDLVTRDVGSSSIGMFHTEPVEADRLALHLQIAGTDVDLVIRVLSRAPMGPFYTVGGEYLHRLSQFPLS